MGELSDADLDTCFSFMKNVVLANGKIVREAFSRVKNVSTKSSPTDLVTEVDELVERNIKTAIHDKYPTHRIFLKRSNATSHHNSVRTEFQRLGATAVGAEAAKSVCEETAAAGEPTVFTDAPTWLLDPIDGTTNFVHSLPMCCISIALAVGKQTDLAFIYNPMYDELYTARRGRGAFLNDKPMCVTTRTELSEALVLTGMWRQNSSDIHSVRLSNFVESCVKARAVRCLGSAALDMCMVARGAADAYFENGIHCWDVAAGDLIVREAGGFTCSTKGGSFNLFNRQVVACASQELASELTAILSEVDGFPSDLS